MTFNHFFEGFDLSSAHALACVFGLFVSVWVSQLWSREAFGGETCWSVRNLRRLSLILFAMALCWSLAYEDARHWQPSPPDLLIIIAVDLYLLATILSAAVKKRAFG